MSIKNKSVKIAVPLILALATSCAGLNESNVVSEVHCIQSSGDLCRVPFSEILSQRNALLGRTISTKGVLVKEGGNVALYENSEHSKYGIHEGAILLRLSEADLHAIEGLNRKYVVVVGTLEKSDEYWAGLVVANTPQELPEVIDYYQSAPPRK